jgi:hypothetical protein
MDEPDSGASWFPRRCEASSGDTLLQLRRSLTASLSLGLLGRDALLTMRDAAIYAASGVVQAS